MVLLLQEALKHAASLVCKQTFPLQGICKELVTKSLDKIIHGIMNGKSAEEICVKLRLCKPEKGECRGDSRDSFLEGSHHVPTYVQYGFDPQKSSCHTHPTKLPCSDMLPPPLWGKWGEDG